MIEHHAILKVLDDLDGWSIWEPDKFLNAGFPLEWVSKMTRRHLSDGSPKGTIFGPNGEVKPHLTGIYALEALRSIASELGADTKIARTTFGRGSEARELVTAIKKVIEGGL